MEDDYVPPTMRNQKKSYVFDHSNHKTIPKTQLTETIKLMKKTEIMEELLGINHYNDISAKDYSIGTYNCNEADYYLYQMNIYFGFII